MFQDSRTVEWRFLGSVPYREALTLQERLRERLRHGAGREALLFLEHPHVITLGRNATGQDILVSHEWLRRRDIEVVECDRGGRVTYHGPGQLIGYPIVDLDPDRRDLRRYMRDLQEVLIRTLDRLGVEASAQHRTQEIGVWVDGRKIASLGVHVSRWLTTHGFALNLNTDLSYFGTIVPCGLAAVEMTSVELETGHRYRLEEVARICADCFAARFGRRLEQVDSVGWEL